MKYTKEIWYHTSNWHLRNTLTKKREQKGPCTGTKNETLLNSECLAETSKLSSEDVKHQT